MTAQQALGRAGHPDGQPGAGPPRLRFGGASRWVDLDGPVHYLDFGGPADGPVIVGVHGLNGSAVNWAALAPLLTGHCRLLAPDLAGHGMTRSSGRSTKVPANRALLHRFIETVPGSPVILMGNSMGGMISLGEAAQDPGTVAGLILIDPALPFLPVRLDPLVTAMFVVYAIPGLGQRVMRRGRRLSPEQLVAGVLELCCGDVTRISRTTFEQHVEMARRRAAIADGEQDFLTAARSVVAEAAYVTGRGYRRAVRSASGPVLLLHGSLDRLVPVASARAAARAHPDWTFVELPGVGHVPQLEVPQQCATLITGWLAGAGRPAAEQMAKVPPDQERRLYQRP
jgi:pimeloyl-ACP methyl ester carboxylesterase